MKVVFNKTLRNMYKPLIIGLYFAVVIFFTIIFIITGREKNNLNIIEQIESIKVTYTIFNFLYLSGIGLIILMMIFGLDIFATEEYEGTMRILVAKPVSRRSIIMGKILGVLAGSFIYYISSLIISLSIYSLFLRLDKDVLVGVLKLVPSFIIYALFIIFFITSITSILSALFKKKTPGIVIFVILVLGIYGVLPITRNIIAERGLYEDLKLQYIDVNSHFGNLYMSLIEQGKEDNELYSQMIIMFTGRYKDNYRDPDFSDNYDYNIEKNNLINVPITALIYIFISIILLYISYNIMSKKDIT